MPRNISILLLILCMDEEPRALAILSFASFSSASWPLSYSNFVGGMSGW